MSVLLSISWLSVVIGIVQFNKILRTGLIYSREARQVRLGKSDAFFGRDINVFLKKPYCVLVMAQAIMYKQLSFSRITPRMFNT